MSQRATELIEYANQPGLNNMSEAHRAAVIADVADQLAALCLDDDEPVLLGDLLELGCSTELADAAVSAFVSALESSEVVSAGDDTTGDDDQGDDDQGEG